MEMFDWLEDHTHGKVELEFTFPAPGAPFLTVTGAVVMLRPSATN